MGGRFIGAMPRLDSADPQSSERQMRIATGGLSSQAARETDEAELRRRARKLALILMAASASLVIALIVGALLFL